MINKDKITKTHINFKAFWIRA